MNPHSRRSSAARSVPLALVLAAASLLAAAPAVRAADVPPPRPGARELAALCTGCGIVAGVAVEKRKGHASGVGAAGGAVAGGVVGHAVGDSTAATVGGAVVGGLLGHEIEKRAKRRKVWITTVTLRDGSSRRFEQESDPALRAGDVVVIEGERLRRR